MFGSSAYSISRPSTAKTARSQLLQSSASGASPWSSAGSFDRSILARTVAIAQTIPRGVMPKGCHVFASISKAISLASGPEHELRPAVSEEPRKLGYSPRGGGSRKPPDLHQHSAILYSRALSEGHWRCRCLISALVPSSALASHHHKFINFLFNFKRERRQREHA